MTDGFDGAEFGAALTDLIKGYVDRRIAALETKIALLEQRNLSYQGVWKNGRVYGLGNFCTFDGSLWHSNMFQNKQRPGNGDAAWTMCVKSGRDGKDAKGAA
jgi:hypothetical protein